MLIRFDKVEWFIKVYDGNRYLILFGPEKYDETCNNIRHLTGLNLLRPTHIVSCNYAKIKVDSYDF